MKKNQYPPATALRWRAEDRMQGARPEAQTMDAARLPHELQVLQIELEMQNEELKQQRARTEASATEMNRLFELSEQSRRALLSLLEDQKRTEEALRQSEARLIEAQRRTQELIEALPNPVFFKDRSGRYLGVNKAWERYFGIAREAFVGKTVYDLYPDNPEIAARLHADDQVLWDGPGTHSYETVITTRDGQRHDAVYYKATLTHRDGSVAGLICNIVDITERKRAELALARESDRNRLLLRNASDGIHILDADGNVLEVSDAFCRMLGYAREELIGANVTLWDAQFSRERLKPLIAEQLARADTSIIETRHRRRDGSFIDVEVTGQGLELDGKSVLFNSARDVTERKRVERALRESELRFRGLVEQSIAGIYIIQDGKFVYVNPRFVEIRGFASAEELIDSPNLSLVAEKDRDLVAEHSRALLAGETQGFNFSYTGLRKDGSTVELGASGTRAIYQDRPAIIGMMQDISEKKRAEAQIQHYMAQLETAFMSTVQVATNLSEMRDPYTSGHSRRVGEIAVAIGAELGLDANGRDGLRVAGYLHDIGKITVPTEILAKPGRLDAMEYDLIKEHAQASYDILKDVAFPWPVAEVAWQHHERMDGSGYPQGLAGDAIRLEARIMAVADVVEAMASDRPYRAGLGLDKALAEIERGRGSIYDAAVADACLNLFRSKRYSIPA